MASTSRGRGRTLLLLGAAAALAAGGALRSRGRLKALLPGAATDPEPYTPPGPPQQSNYDAPGPVANTATPIPAPDPVISDPVQDPLDDDAAEPATDPALLAAQAAALEDAVGAGEPILPADEPPDAGGPAFDEREEEQAAAAEAAAIGGHPSEYASSELGEPIDEAERPLAEAGEGVAEGQEQAEAGLQANLEPRDAGMTDAERQIDDVIEQAGQPSVGETPGPLVSKDDDDEEDGGGWQTWAGGAVKPS